jgi:hypothetical protein
VAHPRILEGAVPSEVTVRVVLREKGGPPDNPLRIFLGYTAEHTRRTPEGNLVGLARLSESRDRVPRLCSAKVAVDSLGENM